MSQWNKASKLLLTSSNCITHWKNSLKLLIQTVLQLRLSKMFLSTSPNCWRDCDNPGSFIHIWRFCPLVLMFWKHMFSFLSKISQLTIACNPTTALLLLHHGSWASLQTSFIVHGIIAARRSLASAWKQPIYPDWSPFVQYLNTQTQFELIFAIKNDKCTTFWKQ